MRLYWSLSACHRGKGESKLRQRAAGCARTWVAPEPETRDRSSSMDKFAEVDASPEASGGSSVAGSRRTAAPSSACSLIALPGAPHRGWAQATRGSSGSRSSSSSSEERVGSQRSAMGPAGGSGAQGSRAPGWGLSIAPNRAARPHRRHLTSPPARARPAQPPATPRPSSPGTPATRMRRRAGGGASEGGAGQVSAGHLCLRPGRCLCAAAGTLPGIPDRCRFFEGASPSNLNNPPLLLYTLYTFISLTLSTKSS